jgi:hypothetical protein
MDSDGPSRESPTIDLTTAFKDVAGDFVDSARNKTELELFLGMAFVAWNVAVRGAGEAEEMISEFIRRFDCETFQIRKARIDTRRKMLDIAARKTRLYPDIKLIIREVQSQDRRDGLYLAVTQSDAV